MTGSLAEAPVIVRTILVAVLLCAPVGAAPAQPCNPVLDGTYCATQPNPRVDWSGSSSGGGYFAPIQGITRDLGPSTDSPATLGAITFRGGQTCIGLFRRGACN
jgi:hypothetical protein